uniref:Gustatory receptor n=1 Tax=Heterorhabditis bacteriophora TaxID=37862 RepID=A0A1I7X839_HETBA
MRFTIYHWTFLSILTLTQAAIIILRLSWSGVAYYRLVRIHNLVNAEFVMIVGSVFIWRRISSALSSLDPERITPVKLRWRTICLHDVARASLIVFLLMSHASFTFYFFLLGSEPHLLAIISLTAVATYLHIFVFLIIVEGIYFSSSLSVQFGILTSFNRLVNSLLNSFILDILAISGDLADGFVQDFESAARPLCSLKAKYGVYFATVMDILKLKNKVLFL